MRTLYLDCGMGAAGDMLTAALLELIPDRQDFIDELNSLGLPGIQYAAETAQKCGIDGTHMSVLVHGSEEDENMHEHHHEYDHENEHDHEHEHNHHHDHDHNHEHEHHHEHDHNHEHDHEHDHDHNHEHHHAHHSLHDIEHIVKDYLNIPEKVREDIIAVYKLIAEAEGHVHGKPMEDIHFHEVGSLDAIADVAAVCLLMNRLSPDMVVASPVHVGSGKVRCAHGILPVPAPATAYILQDIPIYGGRISGELCTPTGAALLKHFVNKFGDMPVMKVENIGYGMGKKDFEIANCVRAMLGTTEDKRDTICELSCNVDDMTGEKLGFAMEKLFDEGALDVYTDSIGMKKSRPGILIRVMCRESDKEKMIGLIFKYTTTIGIRETHYDRHVLSRRIESIATPYGNIRMKVSSGYGVTRKKWEYEDLAEIAKAKGMSIAELERELEGRLL